MSMRSAVGLPVLSAFFLAALPAESADRSFSETRVLNELQVMVPGVPMAQTSSQFPEAHIGECMTRAAVNVAVAKMEMDQVGGLGEVGLRGYCADFGVAEQAIPGLPQNLKEKVVGRQLTVAEAFRVFAEAKTPGFGYLYECSSGRLGPDDKTALQNVYNKYKETADRYGARALGLEFKVDQALVKKACSVRENYLVGEVRPQGIFSIMPNIAASLERSRGRSDEGAAPRNKENLRYF